MTRSTLRKWLATSIALGAGAVLIGATASSGMRGVERWAPPTISSDGFESHSAFDPRTGDIWFVRSGPQFTDWRIMVSRCEPHGLAGAVDAPIAGDGAEADPLLSPIS